MKTTVLRCLTLALFVLAGAGCGGNRPAALEVGPALPLIFYDETGDPSEQTPALSDEERCEIVDAIAARTKTPIWLIRVKPLTWSGTRSGVIVYLTPERQTPRIRTGCAYSIPVLRERMSVSPPWKYAQVSKPDEEFSERLTRPSAVDMPFRWRTSSLPDAVAISEDEMTNVVDFVREPPNYEDSSGRGTPSKHMIQEIQELPILSILKTRDAIHVTFGYQHSGLWGRGISVTVVCAPNGYAITECSSWIS